MDALRQQIGVKARTNDRRLESLHGVDHRGDEGKRFGAMRLNGHLAQIEAGLLGIVLGKEIIGRAAADGDIARNFRAEAPRIVHDERAVDTAAEKRCDRQVGRHADAHGFRKDTVQFLRRGSARDAGDGRL